MNLLTRTDFGKAYFISKSKQTTNLASISSSNLKDFPIVLPPKSEIEKIKAYIEKESELLNQLLSRSAREIDLIREYKTTLIASAVTGGIDVRGWGALPTA